MRFLSKVSADRPLACLAFLALLTLGLAAQLPHLELRTDGSALHPRGDPAVEHTARDRRLFRDPEELIFLLTSEPGGPEVTSVTGLREVVRAHRSIATLPGIRAEGVRSAATLVDVATSTVGSLGSFLDELPHNEAQRSALLRRMRARPWTDGLFLSADGRSAAIYAPLTVALSEPPTPEAEANGRLPDRREVIARASRWTREREPAGFDLHLMGPVVAETILGQRILGDLSRLVPLMVLVIATLLALCLRTPGGLLVAMAKTLVVLVATGGVMSLLSIPITLMTTTLPVLLLALAVTDEVHVIARLQAKLGETPKSTAVPKEEVLSTLDELYRPVVYTSISTAIGFLSFLSASIEPIRHFGALAAVGILLAMVMTFTLTPAVTLLLPASWFRPRGPDLFGRRSAGRARAGSSSTGLARRQRTAALAVGLVLLAAGVPGLLALKVQDSWVENFDPDGPLVRAERQFNSSFWGSYRFDVVLSGTPGLFHQPEGAALVEEAARIGASAPHTRGVVTYLDPLDTVAELLGVQAAIPDLPAGALEAVVRVAQIYDGRTGLHRLLTADGGAARLLFVVNSPDYLRSTAVAEHIDRELGGLLAGSEVTHRASGDIPLALATVRATVRNQLRSIAWTLVGVGALLWLVNRRLRLTSIQLVPPVAAAWLVLSGMGYAGLPLGVATSMFAALTLGVGVDFALHVTYAHEHARRRGLGRGDAVRCGFEHTTAGRRWSTVVLALGFLVLTASDFGPNHHLGLLLCAAMLASFLTTRLFLPHLLAP